MESLIKFFLRYRDASILAFFTVVGLITRLFFVFDPVRYDEAYTYLNFVRLPVLTILTDYSLPNNHLLHSLLAKCSIILFGDTEFGLRFVALLFGVLLIPLSYYMARLYASRPVSFFVSLCVACSHYAIFYSVNARGYTLSAFLLLVGTLLVHRLSRVHTYRDSLLLGLVSALALFTVPSNAPYVLALYIGWFVAIFSGRIQSLYSFFLSGFVGVFATFVLYAGVISRFGLSQITHNDFVVRLSYHEFFSRFVSSLNEWASSFTLDIPLPFAAMIIVLFWIGLYLSFRARQISGILFAVTLVWSILFAQLPPSRVLFPLLPFFYLLVAQGFQFVYTLISRRLVISKLPQYVGGVLVIFIFFFYRFSISSLPETGYFPDHRAICEKIHEISTRHDRVKVIDGDAPFDFCFFKSEIDYYREFSGKVFWVYTDNSYGRDWIAQNLKGISYTFEAQVGNVKIISVSIDPTQL